jgi:hypothetical protein
VLQTHQDAPGPPSECGAGRGTPFGADLCAALNAIICSKVLKYAALEVSSVAGCGSRCDLARPHALAALGHQGAGSMVSTE